VCTKPLQQLDRQYQCQNKHSFDISKENYVNLYHNQGLNAGDDQLMLQARHAILNKGYYKGVSEQLNSLVHL